MVRVSARPTAGAARVPLHGGADPVAVRKGDVIPHSDLVAVVDHGRTGQAQEDRIEHVEFPAIPTEKRREAAADTDVLTHLWVRCVRGVQHVSLGVGHHLEREFVVVTNEHRPLCSGRDVWCCLERGADAGGVAGCESKKEARHHGKMEGHVALVAVAEVGEKVFWQLVRLGEEHCSRVLPIDHRANLLEVLVCCRQVLAVGAFLLEKVRDGVEAQPIESEVEPEPDRIQHRVSHLRVGVVEVRLMVEEPVPVVLARNVIP